MIQKGFGKKIQHVAGSIPCLLSQNLEKRGDGCVGMHFENTFPSSSAAHLILKTIIYTIVLCVFIP